LVNPWNIEVFANLIYEAIKRVESPDKKNTELINYIEKNTSFQWCSRFLHQLNLPNSHKNPHQYSKSPIMMKQNDQNQLLIEIEYAPIKYSEILKRIDSLIAKNSQFKPKIRLRSNSNNPIIQILKDRNIIVEIIDSKRKNIKNDQEILIRDLLVRYSELFENVNVLSFPDCEVMDYSEKDEEFNEFQIPEVSSNLVKAFSSFPVEIHKRKNYILIRYENRNILENLKREGIELFSIDF
jgi:hypothetical protein